MTPNTVSLVTINQRTSYGSGILRQDYGSIHGLPINCTRFVDWVTIWVVHLMSQQITKNYASDHRTAYNGQFITHLECFVNQGPDRWGWGEVRGNCSLMAISADFLIIRPPTTMIWARFKIQD